MRVIKCDICGDELEPYNVRRLTSLFSRDYGEVCTDCYENYKYFEEEYHREKYIIENRYCKKLRKLDEKYEKIIRKYEKTS